MGFHNGRHSLHSIRAEIVNGNNNSICKAHSGFKARIEDCEENVKNLWTKYNNNQKMVLGIFITLSLNLIGVIAVLIRTL